MKLSVNRAQAAAFRLARHHFLDRKPAPLAALCGDTGGIQAQVTAAAELALWARRHDLTRAAIHEALWERRTLVKTSLMRQTLHWVPASEFALYIAALKRSRLAALRRIMAKYAAVTAKEIDELNGAIVAALGRGPLSRRELAERIRPRVSKNVRKWMDMAWSVMTVRGALVEGLICYGPDRDAEVTYVLAERWLPKRKRMDEREAKRFLLCRYLGAFGPATLRDFCKWSGIPAAEASAVWDDIQSELVEVFVDGAPAWLLRRDRAALEHASTEGTVLRLLPNFDAFLLGHAEKDHLVDARHYKKVFRNQGWISPVVLLDGRAIGTWAHSREGRKVQLEVRLFRKAARAVRSLLEEEAVSLGDFLGAPARLRLV